MQCKSDGYGTASQQNYEIACHREPCFASGPCKATRTAFVNRRVYLCAKGISYRICMQKVAAQFFKYYGISYGNCVLYMSQLSRQMRLVKLDELKRNIAAGIDGIRAEFLKDASDILLLTITSLFKSFKWWNFLMRGPLPLFILFSNLILQIIVASQLDRC